MEIFGKLLRPSARNIYHTAGVIFFILAGFVFNLTILQSDRESTHLYRMKLYYPKIDGIYQGTAVFIQGIEKGYVQEIDVVPAKIVPNRFFAEKGKDKVIELTLAMKEPVVLWDNYTVSFNTVSIFSGRVINLDPGYYWGKNSFFFNPVYPAGKKAPDFQPLAYYYESFIPASSLLMLDNRKSLRQITNNLKQITDKATNPKYPGTVSLLVNSSDIHDHLQDTVNDAGILMKEFRWYAEGYSFMYNIPSTFITNIYTNQSTIGKISDMIYNQSSPSNDLSKPFGNFDNGKK